MHSVMGVGMSRAQSLEDLSWVDTTLKIISIIKKHTFEQGRVQGNFKARTLRFHDLQHCVVSRRTVIQS